MISIQRIHIYLNLPTYSYDRIFIGRFCPMKNINHLIYNSVANLSPHCFCRVERATHTNHGIRNKVRMLVLFPWVSCYGARAIKHVCKFLLVCFSLAVVLGNVLKTIHLGTRCTRNVRLGWWTVLLITLRWGKRAPIEELVSSQWIHKAW